MQWSYYNAGNCDDLILQGKFIGEICCEEVEIAGILARGGRRRDYGPFLRTGILASGELQRYSGIPVFRDTGPFPKNWHSCKW